MRNMTESRTLAQRLITVLLGIVMVFSPLGGPSFVAAQGQRESVQAAQEKLNSLFNPLKALRSEIDRTTFDVAALGFELAFEEPEDIVAYVHEAVRFEPYHGVLRGAQGALASGAGNALDQAILTAVLITDAGYEVEIHGGSLSDEQLSLLLGQLREDVPDGVNAVPPAPDLGVDLDLDAIEAETTARITALEADAAAADGMLDRHVELAVDPMYLIEDAAREYYWVVYRLTGGEPWSEAHPIFGETPASFEGIEPTVRMDGDIPPELQHRFRFQVFIERRLGDKVEVKPITDAWERPVANMYGVALNYTNVPDGLEAVVDASDIDELMANTSFFFPMVDGDIASGGQAFDMLGNTAPPDAAGSPFAGLFQSVGGLFGGAAGALGGLGADDSESADDFVSLTAQWFEFTFIAPGGETTTYRRMVTDRLGAEARAAGTVRLDPAMSERDAFAELASVHTFMLDPGRYADAFVLDRTLESVTAMQELVNEALTSVLDGAPPPSMAPKLGSLEAPVGPLMLFSTFNAAPVDEGILSYRPAPALVVMSQRMDGAGSQVDVVTNPRWSLRVSADGVSFDPRTNRQFGVWETRVESLPLARDAEPVIPAFSVLDETGSDELLVIESSAPEVAAGLLVPRAARDAILDDLANGYTVLVPAASIDDLAAVGWWRVDPVTGETLGRGGDGRGQAFVEYLTSFEVSVAITAGFTVYGVHQCTKIEDSRVAGCCIIQNVVLAGAGVAVGVAAGIYFGVGKALVLFGALDVGGNIGATFIPTVCS